MNISTATYEALTPEERVQAAISALSRNDEKEIARLSTTCPKRTFTMTDPRYSDRMDVLHRLGAIVEANLRGFALDFFIFSRPGLNATHDGRLACLEREEWAESEFGNLLVAWRRFLAECGLDVEEAERALRSPHPAVTVLSQVADPIGEPEAVEMWVAEFRRHVEATTA